MGTEHTFQPRLHTVGQTSERLSIGRASLYKLLRSGALRSVKVSGRRLVSEQAIVDFIAGLDADGGAR